MIHYVKDDLFNAPAEHLLVHACNCQGVWGSGIAKEFKNRFPEAFKVYQYACCTRGRNVLGTAIVIDRKVGCLFTSRDYGARVDSQKSILTNTRSAVEALVAQSAGLTIAMPKINSGLFNVPWKDTEAILNEFDRDFYVYSLE